MSSNVSLITFESEKLDGVSLCVSINCTSLPQRHTHTNTHTPSAIGRVGGGGFWMINSGTEITSRVGLCCIPQPRRH